MRRPLDARSQLFIPATLLVISACGRSDEPVALPPPPSSAIPHPAGSVPTPRTHTAPPADSSMLPRASHDPDMGLGTVDPAREYVVRYLHASRRYDRKPCVTVKPSTFSGDHSVVETENDPSGACGKPGELRDRFFVTIATDRMSLDPSLHGAKLQPWPDGSDPDGPPGKVADIQDLHQWKNVLRDGFHKLQLAPLRMQLYGRGSYPVVSIAGWHGKVERSMTPAELEGPAKELCAANDGGPLGIFAGIDRATLLRIECPGSARFEAL